MEFDHLAWALIGMAGFGSTIFGIFWSKSRWSVRDCLATIGVGLLFGVVGILIRSLSLSNSLLELLLIPAWASALEDYFGPRLQVTGYVIVAGGIGVAISRTLRNKARGAQAL